VAIVAELSAGVVRLPVSVFDWHAASPRIPARRKSRE